jgi:fermentation-respiration switch protein FrsA (DUF1100 family)
MQTPLARKTKTATMLHFFLLALVIYGIYCTALFVLQRHMIFPRGLIAHPPGFKADDQGVQKIWLNTAGGKIETWFLPPVGAGPTRRAPVVIFAHGNAELIDFCAADMRPLTFQGIGVLLVEFPGYGRSTGRPSQAAITEAFTAAYDMIAARDDVDPAKIVLFGRSLGGGAICALAARRPSAAMMLTSSFTSIRSFAARYLAPGFLVRDPFDNLAVVRNYPGPILIIHGRHDEVIPFRHGKALYEAARNARLVVYECGHNDCPADWHRHWANINAFLKDAGIIN